MRTQKRHKTQKQPKIVVGYVYADWCGHCKALKPIWEKMKKILPANLVTYEEVNSNRQDKHIPEINKKHGVNMTAPQGYPYIFKIHGGNVEEYAGERDAHKMAQWFRGGGSDKKELEEAVGPSSVSDSFGKGIFRGGVNTKRNLNKTHKQKSNKNKTQKSKSFFSSWF